jgi:serine/threonine-protein kinase GIN4
VRAPNSGHKSNRKPFGNANNRENIAQPQFVKPVDHQPKRRSRVLGDSTARYANDENMDKPKKMKEVKSKEKINHVKQRVRDWEIERQRLRELQRLEELEREQEEEADEEQELEQEPEQERRPIPPSITLQSPRIPSAPSSGTFLRFMH